MRVPKKSTATYKNAHFFLPIFPALPIFPPVPQSPVRLALLTLPAFLALSEKFSSIPSLYFRYRKDTRSPKDYRKMSEAQTSNHRLKTRKISYANPIHNLFRFSHSSQSSHPSQSSHLSHLTKKKLLIAEKTND